MAPEVLLNKVQKEQVRKIDVYSFGLIMFELFFERMPYADHDFESVITLGTQVVNGLRPTIPPNTFERVSQQERDYLTLMQQCWVQEAEERPEFEDIYTLLLEISK
jgi:serine/threonine protein kinase